MFAYGMNISGTYDFSRARRASPLCFRLERASKSAMLHVPWCAAALPQPLPRPITAVCDRVHSLSAHADLCTPLLITIAGVVAEVPSKPATRAPGYGVHPAVSVHCLPPSNSTALVIAPATGASPCFLYS
jgi:hypothetical protein